MKLARDYKFIVGLVAFAAFLYMFVLNIQSIFGVAVSLYRALIPLITGVFIAFILDIIVYRYETNFFNGTNNRFLKKIKRPFCTIAGLVSVAFMIGFVMYMAIPQTIHSIILALQNLPAIYTKMMEYSAQLRADYPVISQVVVDKYFVSVNNVEQVMSHATNWTSGLVSTFGNLLYFFVNLLIGFVFSIYLLLNKEDLIRETHEFTQAYFPPNIRNHSIYVFSILNKTFSNFFVGQFLDALILGILVGFGMLVFRIPYALNIACVIGLTALVPLLGAYVGATIGVIMLLVESPVDAIMFLAILIVVQQLENNFIYPKIVGNSIGLPGIWVFASIIVGGNLFGVIGMLLAVPLVASIYKIIRNDVKKRLEMQADRQNLHN